MGCDIYYQCDSAERGAVERLVALLKRWSEEREEAYKIVDIKNGALSEASPWPWPNMSNSSGEDNSDYHLFQVLFDTDSDISQKSAWENYRSEAETIREYLQHCKERVDLYGIIPEVQPWEDLDAEERVKLWNRGQFVFDFSSNGRLVRCSIEPQYLQSSDTTVPCFFIEPKGYWRDLSSGSTGLLRFLTLCKIRYLPELEFHSDYGEEDLLMEEFYDNKRFGIRCWR